MKYLKVAVASLGYELPPHVISSEAIEDRLAPLYQRLGLSSGRLELMTGIRERRHFDEDVTPSFIATRAGRMALERAPSLVQRIGCVIHASVCRDFLEPATANVVHEALRLPANAAVFDVSNACLGVANGMLIVANMIELGQIEAGLVVSGENGRPLLEATVAALLADETISRRSMKSAFASLTIGSGGAAVLLARSDLAPGAARLVGGTVLAATEHHTLCRGGAAQVGHSPRDADKRGQAADKSEQAADRSERDAGKSERAAGKNERAAGTKARDTGIGSGGAVMMDTDAEALLHAGLDLAEKNWRFFVEETSFGRPQDRVVDRVVTHQVGKAHQRLLFERLGLQQDTGYVTFDRLGNIGSASLPITLALAEDARFVERGHRVAMLGIGSGLSSIMMALDW